MRSSKRGLLRGRASPVTGLMRVVVGELAIARSLLAWLPLWLLAACFLVGLVLAYQIPHVYTVEVGSSQDEAYVRNFHPRATEEGHDYRWSDTYGYVSFAGLGGSRPFTVSVELDPARTAPVTLIVNGVSLFSQTLQPGWQTVALRIDEAHPSALASRDTVLEIRAPKYATEDSPSELKGVKVAMVQVEQARSGGLIYPPYLRAALLAAAIVLTYLFVGRALFGIATPGRSRLWGLVVALAASVGLLLWLVNSPVAVSLSVAHVIITSAFMLALLMVVDNSISSGLTGRGLAVCLAMGFGLRYGGMALPQSVIIDMPWHMAWLEKLLAGNWQALYFPSENGLSSVPKEWGLNVLIPKSPLFYFAAAPLSLLPFDLETSVKCLVCFLDTTLIIAVYWLALRLGASGRAAVLAAALYALMPLAFRAFAYGILPTILAQWLAVGVFVMLLALGGQSWSLLHWAGLTALLTLALLAFPTVALFLTLVLLAVWLVLIFDRQASSGGGWRNWRIPLVVTVAWVLALWSYYGLYAGLVLTSTEAMLGPQSASGSTVRWPGGLPDLLSWTAAYVVSVLPALLAGLGLLILFARRTVSRDRRRTLWLVAAWAGIAPVFMLANYRVDMIGKHLFFAMVPFAVAGGVGLWQIGRRGRLAALLAGLSLFSIGWQGLIFWVERLMRAST